MHNPVHDTVKAYNMRLPRTDHLMGTGEVMEALSLSRPAAADFMRRYGKRLGWKYVISRSEFERIVRPHV